MIQSFIYKGLTTMQYINQNYILQLYATVYKGVNTFHLLFTTFLHYDIP